jgi:hypothetical protein
MDLFIPRRDHHSHFFIPKILFGDEFLFSGVEIIFSGDKKFGDKSIFSGTKGFGEIEYFSGTHKFTRKILK